MTLDLTLFNAINGLAGRFAVLDYIGIFFAVYGVYVIVLIVLARREQNVMINAALAFILVFVVEFFIQMFFQRPRPFVGHEVNLLIQHPSDPGFPSSHASSSFAMAASLYFIDKKWGSVALVIAGLVALSRVFVGVHYFLDVFGGAVIGIVCAGAVKISRKLMRKL